MIALVGTAWGTFSSLLLKLLVPVGSILLGWFWGNWRANRNWENKHFKGVVVMSLNSITLFQAEEKEGGEVAALKLRTLFERNIGDVFPNQAMRALVEKAIDKTTETDPMLRFPKEDSWFILNSILNRLGEQFALGSMKSDMGISTEKRWYTFCVTFENDGRMHQFKPRVLLLDRERFLAFPQEGDVILESPKHLLRVETIRLMQKEYKTNPHLFMSMEIAI